MGARAGKVPGPPISAAGMRNGPEARCAASAGTRRRDRAVGRTLGPALRPAAAPQHSSAGQPPPRKLLSPAAAAAAAGTWLLRQNGPA